MDSIPLALRPGGSLLPAWNPRAHEKGGVGGQIGWFRRNHLVPVPEAATLAELNEMVERWDEADDARRIRSRPRTIGEYFTAERPLLGSLPDEPFETGQPFTLRVDRYSQISVRTNRYSVFVRLIVRTVRAMLHASELVVHDGREEVARHERLIAKGGCRLDLDHYLEALLRKPGALPGATALDQARSEGRFTPVHDAWWAAAARAHGERDGTRALTADAVALEARKAAEEDCHAQEEPVPPAAGQPNESESCPATRTRRTRLRPPQAVADPAPDPLFHQSHRNHRKLTRS
ncbi:hypothetical protein ACFWB2_43415 [Streptomyces virginiae]|uniref:Mu transposase domain-containing protein n=1 Tax=Streptomyces virginiae TaxID=1961 RepID=UPI0036BED575